MASKIWDLLIIGSGPAGITAAIYAKRANLDVAIIEKSAPGGKVLKTSYIENYPGFKKILGNELAMAMYEQLTENNVEYIANEVIDVVKEKNIFKVFFEDKTNLQAKTVIVATGTKERLIGVPGEIDFYGKGVSYCAVCDAALHKNETIVVVGGGNSALEEALYLTNFAKQVILIHRRQGFRAENMLVDKVKNHHKIKLILDATLHSIYGKESVEYIKYTNLLTNKIFKINTKIIFPLIGSDPITQFLQKFDILDANQYVIVKENMETKIPGLYAAGDINVKSLRQISTAIADGSIAAQTAFHYIDNLN